MTQTENTGELSRVVKDISLLLELFRMKYLIEIQDFSNKEKLRKVIGSPHISTLKRHFNRLKELGFELESESKYLKFKPNPNTSNRTLTQIRDLTAQLNRIMNQEFDKSKFMSFDHESFDTSANSKFSALAQFSADRKVVAFFYSAVGKEVPKRTIVLPCLVAERNNRFYCIAYRFDKERFITYSIDRIDSKEVQQVDDQFAYAEAIENMPDFDKEAWFSHIIGISNEDAEILDIELLYTPKQALYMREYPIHPNEKPIYDDERGRCTQVQLKNSYELMAKILELGAGVEVLKPEILRNEIKGMLQQILKTYEK
jgi:predicted DNA-binding transcriptional regulator YafY